MSPIGSDLDSAKSYEPSGYVLRILDGPRSGESFSLEQRRMVVGRFPSDCVYLQKDNTVRRFPIHWSAKLQRHWLDTWSHVHRVSHNQRVCDDHEQVLLAPGDRIQIGRTVLVLELSETHVRSPDAYER